MVRVTRTGEFPDGAPPTPSRRTPRPNTQNGMPVIPSVALTRFLRNHPGLAEFLRTNPGARRVTCRNPQMIHDLAERVNGLARLDVNSPHRDLVRYFEALRLENEPSAPSRPIRATRIRQSTVRAPLSTPSPVGAARFGSPNSPTNSPPFLTNYDPSLRRPARPSLLGIENPGSRLPPDAPLEEEEPLLPDLEAGTPGTPPPTCRPPFKPYGKDPNDKQGPGSSMSIK